MKLPNGHLAEFGIKIEEYCLNPNHNKGKHKAILFQSKLGINRNNAYILEQALRDAAIHELVTLRKQDEHGNHYTMKFWLKTAIGESLILVGWIIRHGEDFPRLTSCYPVEK